MTIMGSIYNDIISSACKVMKKIFNEGMRVYIIE